MLENTDPARNPNFLNPKEAQDLDQFQMIKEAQDSLRSVLHQLQEKGIEGDYTQAQISQQVVEGYKNPKRKVAHRLISTLLRLDMAMSKPAQERSTEEVALIQAEVEAVSAEGADTVTADEKIEKRIEQLSALDYLQGISVKENPAIVDEIVNAYNERVKKVQQGRTQSLHDRLRSPYEEKN